MAIKIDGNAWKRRQWRGRGMNWITRDFTPRVLKGTPQYTMDDLFISPLRQRRRYNEDGYVSYELMERNTAPTGIHIFDDFLRYLAEGKSSVQDFADRHGLRLTDIDGMIFMLTGMSGQDFRIAFQVRAADELLRYTNMEMAEVARRSGVGSANNLYLTYKRDFGVAPGKRRRQIRKEGDLGRYIP